MFAESKFTPDDKKLYVQAARKVYEELKTQIDMISLKLS